MSTEREDDFAVRRTHLQGLSDEALQQRFWSLVDQIVEPLIEEARSHTTPAIERSVLLRMGLSSVDARALVGQMQQRGVLGHGAGRLLLELAKAKGGTVEQTAASLLKGELWQELPL